MKRKLTTIVAMDVVGYSGLMEQDEEATLASLKKLRRDLVDPAIVRHEGRVIKLIGDGTLAEFSSVVEALQFAIDVQSQIAGNSFAEYGIKLRIGLHVGDVLVEGDDIYGDGVNVAARLESIAEPGAIVLSKQAQDHIGDRLPVKFISLGEQSLKNIDRPIEAFKVDLGSNESGSSDQVLKFGEFEMDLNSYELLQSGEPVSVEPKVFDLISYLARNRRRTVSKDEIFAEIWNGRIVSDAALSSQVKAARKVLGDDGTSQHTIRTVHGRGFRFVADLTITTPVQPQPTPELQEIEPLKAVTVKPSR